jgi:hypothetical protein
MFLKYKTFKGLHVLNVVYWVFDQKSLILKILSKTDISLILFQQ